VLGGGVHLGDPALRVGQHDGVERRLEDGAVALGFELDLRAGALRVLLGEAGAYALLDGVDDDVGEPLQALDARRVEGARHVVHDRERSHACPAAQHERHPGVGPDHRSAVHERVLREAVVDEGIADDEVPAGVDDTRAERDLPLRLRDSDPAPSLEPLPSIIDERHDRHGRVEECARDVDHRFEGRLRGGVQDVERAQRFLTRTLCQPLALRLRYRHQPPLPVGSLLLARHGNQAQQARGRRSPRS
jgi:hypothetical protein